MSADQIKDVCHTLVLRVPELRHWFNELYGS